MASPNRGGGGRDRLSELPDGVIGHVLSFLPTKEAARAAVLARSWRHKFAYVHTISFVEYVAPFRGDDYTFYLNAGDRRSKNGAFLDDVNAALLCRRRCTGDRNAAPRAFRVHFGGYYDWDGPVVSQWLSHLLRRSGPELHLDLRLQLTVMGEHYAGEPDHHGGAVSEADDRCPVPYNHYVADMFTLPVSLFSSVAIRTLCLGGCDLDPPEIIRLPLLETLLLSSISELDCGGIQRLISCCPHLVDLTLEWCDTLTITVLDKHLRRLAIRCCHTLVSVTVDASELREFEYRGAVPAESLVTLHGARKISSCHIGFCGKKVRNGDFSRFRMFLEQFTATRHLHLVSTHLGSDIESESLTGFPS
ncbi:F-box/LRR-repeat protein At3g59200-like [Triticum aestivum]|uniref:F-box/LRR-repeat protein At3g59200-like n=1 Tax=Triticum aestivum TaxID=4565 RepID=UPI000844ADA7|nr:F-box/LRR-repeat protein At3g59200-like [Triticum aestivum]